MTAVISSFFLLAVQPVIGGEIINDAPPAKGYTIILTAPGTTHDSTSPKFSIGPDGKFTLPGLVAGNYKMRIEVGKKMSLTIPEVWLDESCTNLPIYWPTEMNSEKRREMGAALFTEGRSAMDAGDYSGAAQKFMQAIRVDTANSPTWAALSLAQIGAKQYQNALESVEFAIRFAPREDSYWNNKGGVLYRMGQYPAAAAAYEKAAELNSNGAGLYMSNAGAACVAANDDRGAASCYAVAVKANAPASSWYHLGEAYVRLGRSDEARDAFTKYLGVEPNGIYAGNARRRLQSLGG